MPSIFKTIRSATALVRMLSTLDLRCEEKMKELYYYEQQIKRDLQGIHLCGRRCNERLKSKTDGSTHLTYTELHGDLENLNIETRLIGESFECVKVSDYFFFSFFLKLRSSHTLLC